MSIEDHLAKLTQAVTELRKVMEANSGGNTAGSAGSTDEAADTAKKAPAKKAPAKKAPAKKAEPKHDKDEVAQIMRQAAREVDKAQVQEYIAEQGCKDLADLLTKPELFDAAHDFAEALLQGEEEEEDEEDEI